MRDSDKPSCVTAQLVLPSGSERRRGSPHCALVLPNGYAVLLRRKSMVAVVAKQHGSKPYRVCGVCCNALLGTSTCGE